MLNVLQLELAYQPIAKFRAISFCSKYECKIAGLYFILMQDNIYLFIFELKFLSSFWVGGHKLVRGRCISNEPRLFGLAGGDEDIYTKKYRGSISSSTRQKVICKLPGIMEKIDQRPRGTLITHLLSPAPQQL